MRRFKLFMGFLSVMFVGGAVGLVTPTESQAGQPDKNLNKHCEEVGPWRGVIPGDERFVPTFIDEAGVAHAYCDRQTGRVWETVPSTDTFVWGKVQNSAFNATRHCINRPVGTNGQKGWRLPSIAELASLVVTTSDSCTMDSKCIPDGSPFEIVPTAHYWSATELADDPTDAWLVFFSNGNVFPDSKGNDRRAWCVRGATDAAVY